MEMREHGYHCHGVRMSVSEDALVHPTPMTTALHIAGEKLGDFWLRPGSKLRRRIKRRIEVRPRVGKLDRVLSLVDIAHLPLRISDRGRRRDYLHAAPTSLPVSRNL